MHLGKAIFLNLVSIHGLYAQTFEVDTTVSGEVTYSDNVVNKATFAYTASGNANGSPNQVVFENDLSNHGTMNFSSSSEFLYDVTVEGSFSNDDQIEFNNFAAATFKGNSFINSGQLNISPNFENTNMFLLNNDIIQNTGTIDLNNNVLLSWTNTFQNDGTINSSPKQITNLMVNGSIVGSGKIISGPLGIYFTHPGKYTIDVPIETLPLESGFYENEIDAIVYMENAEPTKIQKFRLGFDDLLLMILYPVPDTHEFNSETGIFTAEYQGKKTIFDLGPNMAISLEAETPFSFPDHVATVYAIYFHKVHDVQPPTTTAIIDDKQITHEVVLSYSAKFDVYSRTEETFTYTSTVQHPFPNDTTYIFEAAEGVTDYVYGSYYTATNQLGGEYTTYRNYTHSPPPLTTATHTVGKNIEADIVSYFITTDKGGNIVTENSTQTITLYSEPNAYSTTTTKNGVIEVDYVTYFPSTGADGDIGTGTSTSTVSLITPATSEKKSSVATPSSTILASSTMHSSSKASSSSVKASPSLLKVASSANVTSLTAVVSSSHDSLSKIRHSTGVVSSSGTLSYKPVSSFSNTSSLAKSSNIQSSRPTSSAHASSTYDSQAIILSSFGIQSHRNDLNSGSNTGIQSGSDIIASPSIEYSEPAPITETVTVEGNIVTHLITYCPIVDSRGHTHTSASTITVSCDENSYTTGKSVWSSYSGSTTSASNSKNNNADENLGINNADNNAASYAGNNTPHHNAGSGDKTTSETSISSVSSKVLGSSASSGSSINPHGSILSSSGRFGNADNSNVSIEGPESSSAFATVEFHGNANQLIPSSFFCIVLFAFLM